MDFTENLFYNLDINYKDYIKIDNKNNLKNFRKNFYSKIKYSNYDELLKLTLNDIKKNYIS